MALWTLLTITAVPAALADFKLSSAVMKVWPPARHEERCGPFPGCTRFVAHRLVANCVAAGGSWALRPEARVHALIYIANSSFIRHERGHIRDMVASVESHFAGVERMSFPSAEACSDAGAELRRDFPGLLRRFAADSMARRH